MDLAVSFKVVVNKIFLSGNRVVVHIVYLVIPSERRDEIELNAP